MSNRPVKAIDSNHEIMAGWDPPFQTFFLHVIDTRCEEDDPRRDVVWIGTSLEEIPNVADILPLLWKYADPKAFPPNYTERLIMDARKNI